ncbi:hypothetical protein PV343_03975 [Streptomyces sp. WI03-4A]|uniref:hypothetical protein n=1 Tax=Streptomyces TaxID=1883 RepID=UPI0029AEF897|nr:hypothetical protein [Streptomyces sp. WI03-4A]MDX2591446.1 hypothetical protein [Streptomyces sp. WI03-4A]
MAKQRITVCVPSPSDPAAPDALHRAIGEVMAPYHYDSEPLPHPNWVGEWDYWFVSGSNCPFAVLPGHEDDLRLVRHDEWEKSSGELPRDRCHGGPHGLLDLDTDRQAATAVATVMVRARCAGVVRRRADVNGTAISPCSVVAKGRSLQPGSRPQPVPGPRVPGPPWRSGTAFREVGPLPRWCARTQKPF